MVNIRDERTKLGLSQKDLARMVGVSDAAVCKWETGKIQNITIENAAKLASVFGCSPLDFIDSDSVQNTRKDSDYICFMLDNSGGNINEVIVRYNSLSVNEQETVLSLLRALGAKK